MKKLIFLIPFLTIFLFFCTKTVPEAHFSTDTVTPEVGRDVHFTNNSLNASRFEWDFGDGFVSNDANPSHYYTATGPYEVTLKAISDNGLEDEAKISIDVMVPTLLEIEVRENNDNEYIVPDASIILYPTLVDWDNQTNKFDEGIADKYGIVVFSNLDPYVYYVDVWEKTHDNWNLGANSADWIRTPEVMPNVINRFIAWVDVVDHGKGVGEGKKTVLIKRIEKVSVCKGQPAPVNSTEGWQELYARSIKIR